MADEMNGTGAKVYEPGLTVGMLEAAMARCADGNRVVVDVIDRYGFEDFYTIDGVGMLRGAGGSAPYPAEGIVVLYAIEGRESPDGAAGKGDGESDG